MPWQLVQTTTHPIAMPWYTPLLTLYALVVDTHPIYLSTPNYTPYMRWLHYTHFRPWYIPLHTLHALVHTTTQ